MDLKDSNLYKKLEEDDNSLAASISLMWQEASKLLQHTIATNPAFTSHGPDHALALIEIMDRATEPLSHDFHLTKDELYILIAGTLLHDIGMLGAINQDEEYQKRLRDNHHIESFHYIKKNWSDLYLKKEYVSAIAEVASAHRKIDILKDIKEYPINNNTPRLKLCSALLRLADELHISSDRVPIGFNVLNLPSVSNNHFEVHTKVTGRNFNSEKGIIEFTVVVDSPEIDTFIKGLKEKIREEFSSIKSIIKDNGIPYKEIRWHEKREKLIKFKLIFLLLKEGMLSQKEILSGLEKEKHNDVESFLRTFGAHSPFKKIKNEYYLLDEEKNFYEIADISYNKHNQEDMITFISSNFAQNFLSDEFLEKLLFKSRDPSEVKFSNLIIRNSPSALKYVIDHRDYIPEKTITGGGILNILSGELVNDFHQIPELLLISGLLDDLHEGKIISQDAWKNLRINQIAEYHKIFDEQKLAQQWVYPENTAELNENTENTKSITLQIAFPPNSTFTPIQLFIASHRLGENLSLVNSTFIGLKVTKHFEINKKELSQISKMSFNYSSMSDSFSGCIPSKFEKISDHQYGINVPIHKGRSISEWQDPINFYFSGTKKGNEQSITINSNLSINFDLLDSESAYYIIEAINDSKAQINIPNINARLTLPSKCLIDLFPFQQTTRSKKIAKKLSSLQKRLKFKISYPLVSLPEKVEDAILKANCKSKLLAQKSWEKILREIDKTQKKTYSPAILTRKNKEGMIHERIFWGVFDGIHQPRVNINFNDQQQAKLHEMNKGLDDPKQTLSVTSFLTCSANGAFEFVKNQPLISQPHKRFHPGVLLNHKQSKSVEEHRTKFELQMLPSRDSIWYYLTNTECYVFELTKSERWNFESQYLTQELNDVRRAYIAAKEAYRLKTGDLNINLGFGWVAFLVDRLEEAISVTEEVLESDDEILKFLALVNLGLFFLVKAKNGSDLDISQASEYYGEAVELYNTSDKNLPLNEAIDDIIRFSDKLHQKAEEYLKNFQDLHIQ